MAEYPYLSEVLNYGGGVKYIACMFKGKYKPFYSIVGTLDFITKCREILYKGTEEQVNQMHEILDHWWFPAIIQLESGSYISNDLMKRLDEKLASIIDDPYRKATLMDMYDVIFKNIFYPVDNMETPVIIHPAYLLVNMQNEDKEKFNKLHQCNFINSFIIQLKEDYPKHRFP